MNTLINIVPTMLTFGGLTLVRKPGILAQSIQFSRDVLSLTSGFQENECKCLGVEPLKLSVHLVLGYGKSSHVQSGWVTASCQVRNCQDSMSSTGQQRCSVQALDATGNQVMVWVRS